jgi:putative tryptophan/tyrosine transport system substrate-binding protein
MRRREFIAGTALTLGLGKVHAQSSGSQPMLGWLIPTAADRPLPTQGTFTDALARLGWIEGKTIQFERRYVGDEVDRAAAMEARSKEIVALGPNVIFTGTSPAVDAIRRETNTIPIVFVGVANPLAAGFVSSLSHPGGNITGFANFEPSAVGKMIGLLKEIVPRIRTIAFIYSNKFNSGNFTRDWIISRETTDAAAKGHSIALIDTPVGTEEEIKNTFEKLGGDQTAAAIIIADGYFVGLRDLIVMSAARYRVPTIYPFSVFTSAGGLVCYGNSLAEQNRQAAGYIDRILRGAKAADLPVQMPTKYELVINLKTANALGINFPPALLSSADEVIE